MLLLPKQFLHNKWRWERRWNKCLCLWHLSPFCMENCKWNLPEKSYLKSCSWSYLTTLKCRARLLWATFPPSSRPNNDMIDAIHVFWTTWNTLTFFPLLAAFLPQPTRVWLSWCTFGPLPPSLSVWVSAAAVSLRLALAAIAALRRGSLGFKQKNNSMWFLYISQLLFTVSLGAASVYSSGARVDKHASAAELSPGACIKSISKKKTESSYNPQLQW